ncbi:MAG: DUF3606 domain-containing protein [Alphaproteobacteria bacterium]|nr:DUF3606 domain-containing protein [Alphaproteobacteria bacterium]MBV9372709.1 DUF3606 domain-containing protein [Alphaproteobacteria bacterium]MBV9900666.1 DUF3606 domain-containing protein [Alphaproteobacteria bacterium]
MSDDKTKTGGQDRSRVAGGEDYEVEYFARKHGLTAEQARELIARVGNDREALDSAAEEMKTG